MMRIQNTKNNKKYLYIATAAILVVAGIAAVYFFYFRNNDATNSTRAQSDIDQATELAKDPENKSTSPNSDQPNTPAKSQTSDKKTIQMIASASVSNGSLYIRGGLNYPEPEKGTCYAILTSPSGSTVRKDTEILQNPASADCKTISVPVSELSPGKWKVTLQYTSENYEGISNEAEVTIN